MTSELILLPACAMVALSVVISARLLLARVQAVRARRISLRDFRSRATMAVQTADDSRTSDNYMNLFEMPVLFYVVLGLIYAAALTDVVYLWLAWAYVALRIAHSAIHVSYNHVAHRFYCFAASALVVWAMWARFTWQVIEHIGHGV